jgi:hypothetical protein
MYKYFSYFFISLFLYFVFFVYFVGNPFFSRFVHIMIYTC